MNCDRDEELLLGLTITAQAERMRHGLAGDSDPILFGPQEKPTTTAPWTQMGSIAESCGFFWGWKKKPTGQPIRRIGMIRNFGGKEKRNNTNI